MAPPSTSLFHFVMIKPSHYDDDGYPIQWWRSAIPSNTLASLNGLSLDAQRRGVLGPNVEIRLHTYDETNRRVHPDRIIRMIRKAGGNPKYTEYKDAGHVIWDRVFNEPALLPWVFAQRRP